MFGRLFGKKSGPIEEPTWTLATAQDGEMPLIFRIREVSDDLDRSKYPNMIGISWRYEPVDSGMPSEEDKGRMDVLEDLLLPVLESSGNAILTVVVTGNSVREWQWYSQSPEKTMKLVNSALSKQEPFPIDFALQEDPDWEAFSQFTP